MSKFQDSADVTLNGTSGANLVELARYYDARAHEFEQVYVARVDGPAVATLEEIARHLLARERVIEVACGTGFWTERVAPVADSLVGVDLSARALAIAQRKCSDRHGVAFVRGSAFDLPCRSASCGIALAAFWLSHVPLGAVARSLCELERVVRRGGRVVLLDNAEGAVAYRTTYSDAFGNTYEVRDTLHGRSYDILKNIYSERDLMTLLRARGRDLDYGRTGRYWYGSYTVGE